MLYSSVWWNTIWIQDLKKIHDMNYDVEVTWQKESMWLFLNQLQLTSNQGEEPSNKNNDNWN